MELPPTPPPLTASNCISQARKRALTSFGRDTSAQGGKIAVSWTLNQFEELGNQSLYFNQRE
jgi:hypothetical protein